MALGITPAGAGKTVIAFSNKRTVKDHPRRCGENGTIERYGSAGAGSPPQVRGKLFALARTMQPLGITPAGAGKTICCCFKVSNIQDHPRRCGENLLKTVSLEIFGGSPPQVRGKHIVKKDKENQQRITPAGAGKTEKLSYSKLKDRDHPRRCGENFLYRCILLITIGSPPQVRGKLKLRK